MSTQRRFSSKKGFTLIELMVVIVIIGILAAIAIPKLFGMSAKAKASEVGPAAGTWSKMYMAWAMENTPKSDDNPNGQEPTWKKISYKGPGDPAKGSTDEKAKTATDAFTYEETNDGNWSAKNNTKLNDCTEGVWEAEFVAPDYEMPVAKVTGNTAADCEMLTPSFTKIGTKAKATTPPAGGE